MIVTIVLCFISKMHTQSSKSSFTAISNSFAEDFSYLEWIEVAGINGGQVEPCDDCSSYQISTPVPFHFGGSIFSSIYVCNCSSVFL